MNIDDDDDVEKLPPNWLKRYSRNVYRGEAYYYNTATRQRSWKRPKTQHSLNTLKTRNINKWLDDNRKESRRRLEAEYKKFEEILAQIEKDSDTSSEINDSKQNSLEVKSKGSSCSVSETSRCSMQRSFDESSFHKSTMHDCCTQFIRMGDEEALEEVYLIRQHGTILGTTQQETTRSHCIIVDTDIFLSQMTFLINLLEKINEIPGNPTIVIPYAVLNELDLLKMRTNNGNYMQAMQAITFINEQIQLSPHKICGQSAMDNAIKYIDVQNGDDSIINCCLQFKQRFGNVILLSNNVNLRNKSICSYVQAFSKSELEANLFYYNQV